MWMIASLDLSAVPGATAYMSDGAAPVGTWRNGAGLSNRLMIAPLGSLDITDMGAQGGGPQPWLILVGDQDYWCGGNATMSIVVGADGVCTITGDGNDLQAALVPFPSVSPNDIDAFVQMVQMSLVPYPELIPPPPQGRPYTDVEQIAADFFAWSPAAQALGLAVYDWTTADFFRMDVFNYYRYTALASQPLDEGDIVNAIWTTNWPPYQPSNVTFMHSMMMQTCTSEAEVEAQYRQVAYKISYLLDALKGITAAALAAMPRTSVLSVPALYSGQVDVANLGETAFATYFEQYPGNAGPVGAPMGMPLQGALTTFMAPGAFVTLKSFLSTTNSQADALTYSNGILLQIAPAAGAGLWNQCAYVTPLSNEATKTEYLFVPGAQFVMGPSSQQIIDGKPITVIQMTCAV